MQYSPTVRLEVGVDLMQELAVSDEGSIMLYTALNNQGDELGTDEGVSLSDMLDELHRGLREDGEYQRLYVAAHELRRLSEEIYDTARNIEASDAVVLARYNIDAEE